MFWEQFWPQLIATVVGLIIGIPVGLWVSGYQNKREERERKNKILLGLKDELIFNIHVLKRTLDSLPKSTSFEDENLIFYSAKSETWKTFSDGGELEWIKDISILGDLSKAYYVINHYIEKCALITQFQVLAVSGTKISAEKFEVERDNFIESINSGIENLNNATKQIDIYIIE